MVGDNGKGETATGKCDTETGSFGSVLLYSDGRALCKSLGMTPCSLAS